MAARISSRASQPVQRSPGQGGPRFICTMGTELDEATVCRDVARDYAEGIEAWRDALARARQRKG